MTDRSFNGQEGAPKSTPMNPGREARVPVISRSVLDFHKLRGISFSCGKCSVIAVCQGVAVVCCDVAAVQNDRLQQLPPVAISPGRIC